MVLSSICMFSFKHFLFTPQLGVLLCFLLASVGCLVNVKKWGLNFSNLTIFVVSVGLISIVFISLLFQKFYSLNTLLYNITLNNSKVYIDIKKSRVILWTFIQFFNLLLVVQFLLSQPGASTLQTAINMYRNSIYLTGDAVALPFLTRITRSMCIYSGYLFLYLLSYNIVNKIESKLNTFYIINIVCATLTSLIIGGSRGSLLQYLVSGITIYFTLYSFKSYRAFSKRQVFGVIFILMLFIILFGQMSTWLGRGEVEILSDTIFTYLSGGLANLDTYLQNNLYYQTNKNYTFVELINSFFRLSGQNHLQYRGILADTYMSRRGFGTGNVYTMFASYYHDGKILGVIAYSCIMSFIGQWLLKLTFVKYKLGKIDIPMIIYGYLFFDFVQCNFSNRFYSQFFTDNMIKFVIFLVLFKYALTADFKKKMRLRLPF